MKKSNRKRFRKWFGYIIMTTSSNGNICGRNSPVTGEFPSQRPVTQSFDVFFDLRLNKRLREPSRRRWFGTPSCSLWRHCNDAMAPSLLRIYGRDGMIMIYLYNLKMCVCVLLLTMPFSLLFSTKKNETLHTIYDLLLQTLTLSSSNHDSDNVWNNICDWLHQYHWRGNVDSWLWWQILKLFLRSHCRWF